MKMNTVDFLNGLFQSPERISEPELTITPEQLSEYWRERWSERAAIREFDGGQAREHAEAEALKEIIDLVNRGDIA
ncbi:MAG: hypothetical protein HJJLKODD_00554 [Phycisphaerae bacterium]|nr:hypothetical protein [Phycisphaerae bacterium]